MTDTTTCAPLLERTLDLVQNAPRSITYTKLAEVGEVSVAWISRFASGKIENPGVCTVQKLHDYLLNVGK